MIFDIRSIHNISPITGIIHVGAFAGEELNEYRSLGLTNTIMFEPQPNLYALTKSKCIEQEKIHNIALGSEKSQKKMYVSWRQGGIPHGAGASSSLLRPKSHIQEHPEVTFPYEIEVTVDLLDDYYESGYNFLNIDVQGYELEVLKGSMNSLPKIDAMVLEVNRDEMYEGCPMVEDLDNFLTEFNFKRVATHWQSKSWGDAVYIKGGGQ